MKCIRCDGLAIYDGYFLQLRWWTCGKCHQRFFEDKAGIKFVIYHIRRRLRPARSNQWYRDKSDRGQGTFCGAPEGYFDVAHNNKAPLWSLEQVKYEPCAECLRIRAEEREGVCHG